MKSEFILGDVLEKLQIFNPIVIYVDDKLVWDDCKSKEEGWIPYDIAIEKLTDRWYKTVRRVDIKVTEFHHTLIEIFTTEA
jgi:hypothetical protein